MLKLAVLLSGSGRTLQNLLDQQANAAWPAQVVLVISDKPGALGLQRAEAAQVPTVVVRKREHPGPTFSERIFDECRRHHADLVCLAGFLQLLTIAPDFEGRVLNIHPALLPKFGGQGMYGHHVHEAVLAAGESQSGCTVHLCTNEYDRGPILLQKTVPVEPDDTPASLADRVFAAECEAYPAAILQLAQQ